MNRERIRLWQRSAPLLALWPAILLATALTFVLPWMYLGWYG